MDQMKHWLWHLSRLTFERILHMHHGGLLGMPQELLTGQYQSASHVYMQDLMRICSQARVYVMLTVPSSTSSTCIGIFQCRT